jgi:hypothetical protein
MRLSKRSKNIIVLLACAILSIVALFYFYFTSFKEALTADEKQKLIDKKKEEMVSMPIDNTWNQITELEFIESISTNMPADLYNKSKFLNEIWNSVRWTIDGKITYDAEKNVFKIKHIDKNTFNKNKTLVSIACGAILGSSTQNITSDKKIKEINKFIDYVNKQFNISLTDEGTILLNKNSSPITSAPITSSPITSVPITSVPITSAPITSAPITFAPITSSPVTSSPITSSPVTSVPITFSPITSAPITSAPLNIDDDNDPNNAL